MHSGGLFTSWDARKSIPLLEPEAETLRLPKVEKGQYYEISVLGVAERQCDCVGNGVIYDCISSSGLESFHSDFNQ